MPIHSVLRVGLSALSTHLSFLFMGLWIAQKSGKLNKQLFKSSQIIFTTLSVSGQQRLKNGIKSVDVLVVDEAGQAVEAETLIPMWVEPKKCLLVGDIKQLPAMVVSEKAKKLHFNRSMMERLLDCGHPYSMLNIQYRMHPEISRWPSRTYYDGKLKNHPSVDDQILKLAPYFFIDIDDGIEEVGSKGHSWMNREEAVSIALIVDYLARSLMINVEQSVSIISFYSAQVNEIQGLLKDKYSKIKVATVDGFQGGENDILIMSCVRANENQQIGFLSDARRLNVALTRAKFSLIILGNSRTLLRSDVAGLVHDVQERKLLFSREVLNQLDDIGGERNHYSRLVEKGNKESLAQRQMTQEKVCRFFNTARGCREGNQCEFKHVN